MRGILLYNPLSGTSRHQRESLVQRVATLLTSHGYILEVHATTHRGSAGNQAREAIAQGAEVIFACGGDGTIHDILQGIVGTTAMLGIIPMGSGNALCRELGIPLHPLKAALAYAHTTQRQLRVGRCNSSQGQRHFLIMAGSGPDGALMYRMLTRSKGRMGRWAYAMHALHLLVRSRFHPFQVRYHSVKGAWHVQTAVSAMALRIGNLGGIFPGIARGASLGNQHMRLILVSPPALLSLPLWFVFSWLHLDRWNPWLHAADIMEFHCEALDGNVHAQADGEWIGNLPLSASLSERSLLLHVPLSSLKASPDGQSPSPESTPS
ncbi:MAG: diacylglycerol kinase family protein [Terriglobus sp.]